MGSTFVTKLLAGRYNLLELHIRHIAHGEMYTPKHLYRIRGSNKPNRHTLPKFNKMRAAKVIKLDLPELDSYYMEKLHGEDEEEFYRKQLKLHGLEPTRPIQQQTRFYMACSNMILDPYVPPENDGSFVEMAGDSSGGVLGALKTKSSALADKGKSVALRRWRTALKKISAADPEFDVKTFGERALNIYLEAHHALQQRNEERLHDLVTEHIFPKIWDELELKTLRWHYVKSLEPPTVVHLRQGGGGEETLFGQATVRFHSQQILAIYDQFGRLYLGNEHVARDVLEYVVFENYISNEYGTWRMHGKIASKKSTPLPAVYRTYVKEQKDNLQEKFSYSVKIDEKSIDGEAVAEKSS